MATTRSSALDPRTLAAHFVQGLLMGAADSVPGVSGGTVAFIVGIYDSLISSIGNGFHAVIALLRFDKRSARQRLSQIEWTLIVPLLLGIGTAIVVAAGIVLDVLDRYPEGARALFLGMVAASVLVPWKRILHMTRRTWILAATGTVVAFILSGLPPGTVSDPTAVAIFASAMVAICAMILPGVSGAFLLLVLGMYEPTLDAVHNRDLGYVLTFGAGAAVGLGSFSLLLGASLRRFHDETMAVLVGMMLGSLRALWPWQTDTRALLSPDSSANALTMSAIAVVGFGLVFALERWGSKRPPV
jgi:putative membrane protein